MKKHNGFTLIELVTVIIVIGVLSSIMIFASSEAISTARASSIVSDLRSFSMAAMAMYTDNVDEFKDLSDEELKNKTLKYLHDEGDKPNIGKYHVKRDKEDSLWVGYEFDKADNDRLKTKLSGRADTAKLKGSDDNDPPANKDTKYAANHKSVWLLVRSGTKK